ncbi:MAG: NAD(P)H-dependent oxidoreductase [Clostridiales bacterium]|nr:NAD(P)H-dependent oxidoreductase [Clostridiales bacterium]
MDKKTIGIIVGSLRRDSYNKKVAECLAELLKERFETRMLDIASLALYNEDLDNDAKMPQEWRSFRQDVKAVDAVLFVTPEYNRSVPAALKNALDVASRPMTENAWKGKPGAAVSVTQGKIGGFGANHHLRQAAVCLNIHMMAQPEAYIGGIAEMIGENGVPSEEFMGFLKKFASAFANWIDKN